MSAQTTTTTTTTTSGGAGRRRPPLLRQYRRLMSPRSWAQLRRGIVLGAVTGSLWGLSLLALLPASVSLATGEPSWGLGLGGWLGVLGGCALTAAVTDFVAQRSGMMGALGFMADVHHAIGNRVATLPLSWFNAESAGTLSRAVSQEMVSLGESASHFLHKVSSTVAGCVVIWLGSWLWDWHLGVLLTCAVPLLVLFLRWSRRLVDRGKTVSEPTERELASRIVEFSRCQGALRSCHVGSGYPQLASAFDDADTASHRALWWESAGILLSGALVQAIVVAMITLSAALALGGDLEPLRAVVTIGLCLRFTTMLEDIGNAVNGIEERRQMMNHLSSVMDAQPLPEPQTSSLMGEPGAVELIDVTFGYEEGTTVLREVDLRVPARTMCAVVGPSGAGKTTVARLVARFYDVWSGQVRVGGTDVRSLTTKDLMEQLSMVFQDVYLFDDTLAANVRVGDPDADQERLRWAADLAGVTEIVDRLPQGWDTRVGEGGRALSGGERQRVSIARALLKGAPIVLLDEATSALDAENEANVVAAMEELRRTSTLIVIAHKLETVAAADQVVVLGADGRVAQTGRHADLVTLPGRYRDFWEARSRAQGWTLV